MKTGNTEKLTQLISSLRKPANETPPKQKLQTEEQLSSGGSNAVSVQISQQAVAQQNDSNSQSEKIAALKKQVENGTYEVDSRKVAAAFLTELGLA